ncbi:MAG TPA: NosD domain-containing protein, partial [Thermoplasmata archaeon]|nr:NosD domain-containing protein [Thermoplasmata archaeon]
TVDDSGGADFTKIQDAVDFASDGFMVFVYAGTYAENVVVRKQLEITGEEKQDASTQTVVLDGGGGPVALFLGADRVVVHNLTIRNAEAGVYNDRTNNTRLYDSVVRDYGVGVYENRTLNGWVAHNLITVGRIGVAADHAYDDAIRWNEISYNTQFGGKGYNAHLRNCFNWNSLHHNKIGYFYDPTTDLPPMEFDGNVIADNEVGVKVEDSSAIRITNNTITGGSEGVQLLNSSSEVASNAVSGVAIGVRFRASSSNLTGNTIVASGIGIVGEGGAPRIEGNDLLVASGVAMVLSNLDGAIVRGNDAHGGTIRIVNSHLAVLAPVDSQVILQDSTYDAIVLDATSRVEVRHTVRARAVAPDGTAVAGASVEVRDAANLVVFAGSTDGAGYAPGASLVTEILTAVGTESRNPFTFAVSAPGGSGSLTLIVSGPMEVVVTVRPAVGLAVVAALAVATAVAAALSGVFAVERSRYALLALFLPLYSRLSRDKVLESYTRGRVFEYIELNPGAHFNGILAALGLNNGSLVYHIEVLQREGLVTSRQEGMYRRFYPRGTELPPLLENGTTEAQQRVLKAIEEMPGITQKELARFLGLRQSTLAYQIERLSAMGYIEGVRVGRHVAYRARPKGT